METNCAFRGTTLSRRCCIARASHEKCHKTIHRLVIELDGEMDGDEMGGDRDRGGSTGRGCGDRNPVAAKAKTVGPAGPDCERTGGLARRYAGQCIASGRSLHGPAHGEAM